MKINPINRLFKTDNYSAKDGNQNGRSVKVKQNTHEDSELILRVL